MFLESRVKKDAFFVYHTSELPSWEVFQKKKSLLLLKFLLDLFFSEYSYSILLVYDDFEACDMTQIFPARFKLWLTSKPTDSLVRQLSHKLATRFVMVVIVTGGNTRI